MRKRIWVGPTWLPTPLTLEPDSTPTSHSSRAQKSERHQSPDVRHGPATQTTFPYTLLFLSQALISRGYPCSACTMARNGGRKTRKPSRKFGFRISDFGLLFPVTPLPFALCPFLPRFDS